jgi:hypothetical protein
MFWMVASDVQVEHLSNCGSKRFVADMRDRVRGLVAEGVRAGDDVVSLCL